MALTDKQVHDISDRLADFLDDFDGGVFRFGDVKIRVFEPEVDNGNFAVTFRVISDADDQRDVQRVLIHVNHLIDGPFNKDNPRITFNDENPNNPRITDTFRLEFNNISGYDFFDV